MAEEVKPRVRVPASAKKGEVIEIKTLITHVMETGQRKDKDGKTIPRKIINKFTAKFNGKEVFVVNLEPAISANPFIGFNFKATEAGTFEFAWQDDDGTIYKSEHKLALS
jgi:sulfur-oxidizing protein SoxZ